VIVIDSREQLPYDFDAPTVRMKLDQGDYSILGCEAAVAVERKQVHELFTCFGLDRSRFEREFERLATYHSATVVIEGTFDDVLTPSAYSQMSPKTIMCSLISWEHRYGVTHKFCSDREGARAYTFHYLRLFFEKIVEKHPSIHDVIAAAAARAAGRLNVGGGER